MNIEEMLYEIEDFLKWVVDRHYKYDIQEDFEMCYFVPISSYISNGYVYINYSYYLKNTIKSHTIKKSIQKLDRMYDLYKK